MNLATRLAVALRRESRGSRARLAYFAACLALGVGAIVGVASLISAIETGVRSQSRELLACDFTVSSRRELPPELDGFFERFSSFERTDVLELATMAGTPEGEDARVRLCQLYAVDGAYPFYGELATEPRRPLAELLERSDALACERELAEWLGLTVGNTLRLGGADFELSAVVDDAPGRLDFSMTLGPRVWISSEGLERTALTGFGNRVRHRALFRLPQDEADRDALRDLERDLRAGLADPTFLRFESHFEGQPRVRRSLDRVERYLGLVALLSLLLGGTGVAMIVRAWLAGKAQQTAVLRCLGWRPREVFLLYLVHVSVLALVGSLIGALLGTLAPWFVGRLAPELLPAAFVDLWQPLALARGIGLGVGIAACFSLPALAAVWRVPPARVLRVEAEPLPPHRVLAFAAAALLVGGMFAGAWIQSEDLLWAAAFTGALLVVATVLYFAARAVMRLSTRVPRTRLPAAITVGLSALGRPGSATVGAVVALGLGVLVVVSMWMLESRLTRELRGSLPEDAPTMFFADVQPDQWQTLSDTLRDLGSSRIDSVPVVMARLSAVDGIPVGELAAGRPDESRWVFTREQRLTWMEALGEDNVLVSGELWSRDDLDEISLEEEFARDIGAELGTVLRMNVQGVPLDLTVTSIRSVVWQSFSINFFCVVEPGVLEEAPYFRIAAARLPAERESALELEVARSLPNVTVIRVRAVLEKVSEVLERLAFGVQALGSLTILCGLSILAGAIATTMLERRREAALWKTVGVTRSGVALFFASEYALCGLLAGTLGGVGATVFATGFLTRVLELEPQIPWSVPLVSGLACALASVVAGLLASRRALAAPPMEVLRGN